MINKENQVVMKTISLCWLCFVLLGLRSQTIQNYVIASGGGHAQSANFNVSMTIGEPVIETFYSTQKHLTQGFHQHFVMATIIEDNPALSDITMFPNPVEQYLTLNIPGGSNLKLMILLFDMNGKLLFYREINEEVVTIDFTSYMAAIYFLEIRYTQQNIRKVWKIVKQE